MALKDQIIDEIIRKEGGYVNDPADSGGETNWGITVNRARQSGYNGDMRTMPRSDQRLFCSRRFFDCL